MFGIAGTAELSTFCPGTGTWNRLQDGTVVSTKFAELLTVHCCRPLQAFCLQNACRLPCLFGKSWLLAQSVPYMVIRIRRLCYRQPKA